MSHDRSFLRRFRARGEPAPARSERLTFEYDENGVRLVRRILRNKAAPPGRELSSPPPPGGVWVEVQVEGGRAVYRRMLPEPIRQTAEVFEPDGTIRAVPFAPAAGVFSVVVPAPAEAAVAVVVAGPETPIAQPGLQPGPAERGQARELVRVALGAG